MMSAISDKYVTQIEKCIYALAITHLLPSE